MNAVIDAPSTPRKTNRRGRHPDKALSVAFVRTAPTGRHADGNGLYLFVQPTGTRSWVQRLVVRGRRREIGLGSVALVSLAEAREKAWANRKRAREGGDPLAEKRRTQDVPTFAAAAQRALEQKQPGWGNRKNGRDWLRSLERYAFPRIGNRPVSEVTGADVLEILTPIWHRKAQTAQSVRQRIGMVMKWAIAMEFRIDNSCDRIGPVLGPQDNVVEHMRALPHGDVAAPIETVRASEAPAVLALAFEFLVLTAARWGEVRGAEWAVIDRVAGVWTVPAARMKAKREHRVPLGGRALKILDAAWAAGDRSSRFVFTTGGGKPIENTRLRRLLKRERIGAVPHGFRTSFQNWAAEETDHPGEVIEAALAHVVQNKVEAAYRRTDLFQRRRLLMEDWSRYLVQGTAKDWGL